MDFIEIDGSQGEGGGQILRTSLSLATILRKPIRISRIRAGRESPGLRPQHLQAALVCAKISGGIARGAEVGSTTLEYLPGNRLGTFHERIDTGTAGSVSLIAQTIIPISLFGGVTLDVEVVGGTEVPGAPTVDYLDRIMVPIYKSLGANIEFKIKRRGYYPRGGGVIEIKCKGPAGKSNVIKFQNKHDLPHDPVRILSVSRSLPEHVSKRQLDAASAVLRGSGLLQKEPIGEVDWAGDSLSPGSSVLIYKASQLSSCFAGASALGQRGKRAEAVGEEAARSFLAEGRPLPNVDRHLADMLVTLLCCVDGRSEFSTSTITNHFSTNAEIARKLTGCAVDYSEEAGTGRWLVVITGRKLA